MRDAIRNVLLAGAVVVLGASLAARAAWVGQDASRAQEVLAQARAALGGEAQLKAIQSLSISGSIRRMMGMGQLEGDLSIDLQLPDKYRKSETFSPTLETYATTIQIVNGAEVALDSESSGSGMMFNSPNLAQATPEMKALIELGVRAEYARVMIVLLLTPPATFPVEFSYIGEEETSGQRADVLEAKGPEGFAARLHLDLKTHLPVMLSYKEKMRGNVQMRANSGESREEMQKRMQDTMAKSSATENEVEIQLRFSDYKPTGGILFPRKISRMTGERLTEEREYSKFKISPTLKPERFKKKAP